MPPEKHAFLPVKKPFSKPVFFAVAVFLWTVAFFFLSLHVVTANPRQEDSFFVQLERNMTQSHVLQPIGSLRLDDKDRQKIESRIGSNGIAISKHSLSFQPFFRNEQVSEIIPPFGFAEFDNAILSSYPLLVGNAPSAEQDILLASLHLYL